MLNFLQRKKITIVLLTLIILVVTAVNTVNKSEKPICFDEYENPEDYIKDLGQWLDDYYKKYPNATKEEVFSARDEFMIESNCIK